MIEQKMTEQKRITVRELRAHLHTYLNSGEVVEIGNCYQLRGFLVSIPAHNKWNDGETRKAIDIAKRKFRAAAKRAAIDAELE